MTRIIGLDLSLQSTGLIDLRIADRGDHENRLYAHRLGTPDGTGHFRGQHLRMNELRDKIRKIVAVGEPGRAVRPRVVMVEKPIVNTAKMKGLVDLLGNWWWQVGALLDYGLDVVEVTPQDLKIYATGSAATNGPRKIGKPEVKAAVWGRYGIKVARVLDQAGGTDVVDGFVLAAMGARVLGSSIETTPMPQTHLRALDKLNLSGILTGMPEAAW